LHGMDMIKEIKEINPDQVILVTSAHDESGYLIDLIDLGITNFIAKPLDLKKFLSAVSKTVHFLRLLKLEKAYLGELESMVTAKTFELQQTMSVLKETRKELVEKLCTAAEYKDTDTGKHIMRIGIFAKRLAQELGKSPEYCSLIGFAAPLHDIGKIGIKDSILHKAGKLTKEEFDLMKSHSLKGAQILEGSHDESIIMAELIARSHHERFDGTGYPQGLKGVEIPLEALITNICDQYDALKMKRSYKPALEHEEVMKILTVGDGRTMPSHFDSKVLEAFVACADEIHQLYLENAD
ncbi:MAG: HD domain-containing protein, partial [SAR324 cluster bacterium]|nr:HD domain-containing protein [SAR324 cluster bacterium]